MGWACSTYKGKQRGAYRVLVRKRKGYRSLGKPRCSWKDIIKMDLKGIGLGT